MKLTRRNFLVAVPLLAIPSSVLARVPSRPSYVKPGDHIVDIHLRAPEWALPNAGGQVITVHEWDGQGYPCDVMDHIIHRVYDFELADFNNPDHVGEDYFIEYDNYGEPANRPNPKWGGMRGYVRIHRFGEEYQKAWMVRRVVQSRDPSSYRMADFLTARQPHQGYPNG